MKLLPNVETTCSMIQQEEGQREALEHRSQPFMLDTFTLFSRNDDEKCTICGKKGNRIDRS